MKRTLPLLSIAVIALLAFFALLSGPAELNVLVFSKTEGFRHDSIEPGIEALRDLADEYDFRIRATEDASLFAEQTLRDVHVVVFLNTTGDVLDEAQQIELRRFIQAGGGFVGVHAAADTEYDWPWYSELVGAWFDSHPNDPNVREGLIHVANAAHESTDMLPADWRRTDEWYDYKDFQAEAVTVLLDVDESSYKRADENPAAEPRPIAWYREFDGGRTFYTGLGHTIESYTEPLFLEHLAGGIRWAGGDGEGVDYDNARVAPEENRFTRTTLATNLAEPMELAVLPDGRVLFVERRGDVHLVDSSGGESITAATIDVHSGHEDGLLGVTLDPAFEENGWVYLFYSPAGDAPKQHVSRFTLVGDQLDLSSETVLLEIPTQRDECCHSGGSLAFGPDGNLFISVGDNTNPHAADGFAPIDGRPGRSAWDARRSAGNTNDLRGKILRITPQSDGSYTIPDGNLFPPGTPDTRPEIYVMGNRNPFRISVDSETGFLYWGEIGPDAGEDSTGRGPMGYDEINQARAAGNFGWPYVIADNQPYHAYDFETGASGPAYDPAGPSNASPHNTGAATVPPVQPAFVWYPYGSSETFPLVGDGGRSAMAGPVYHRADYGDGERKLPEYYDGKLFVYEWMRGWMMAITLDEDGGLARMERFLPSIPLSNLIDLETGPDGALYLLEYGPLWFSASPEARLSRIDYTEGNRPPAAQIAADRTVGAAPFTVAFNADASNDPDGDELTYAWTFDGDAVQAEGATATHTFDRPGSYTARLIVTDAEGVSTTSELPILVGNTPPEVGLEIEGNRSFYWDEVPIVYSAHVEDAEDGGLGSGIDPGRVTVSIDYLPQGADLIAPALGHQAMMEASHALLGKRLMEGSDCAACHQQETASVGPAYVRIAERYAGEADAVTHLAQKIIQGGSGVWGDIAMVPHPQLSEEEAVQMAEYILSLGGDTSQIAGLPLEGSYEPAAHIGRGGIGRYVLMATYTDEGGDGVGPLTGRAVVTLRAPIVQAVEYDETVRGTKFVVPEDAPGGQGGSVIYLAPHGTKTTYRDIDLTDVAAVTGTFAVAPGYTTGGWVDLYLDGTDGEPVGTFEVEQGLADFGAKSATLILDAVDGVHDLTFVYRNEEEEETVCIGVAFEFHHRTDRPGV